MRLLRVSFPRFGLLASLVLLAVLAVVLIQAGQDLDLLEEKKAGKSNQQQVLEAYGKLPLYFIENQGKLDPRVAYYIQGGDKSIYFTGNGVTFALTAAGEGEPSAEGFIQPASYRDDGALTAPSRSRLGLEEARRWVVKLDFVDANPNARPVGQEPTDAVISYFKGPREEWATGLPTYASLVYRDLWPGIDLVYTGTGSRLKYTFLVHPGADPKQIKLAYRGATAVGINDAGQLAVSTPLESFQEDKPYVYQEVDGERLEVAASYSLEGEVPDGAQFGFRVADYDQNKVLVLDPVILLYAGYIGGSSDDQGWGIAVDSTGNAYVTGRARSSEATFPVAVGPDLTFNGNDDDAFVAKVNPSGTALVYAGYIGGSGEEFGWSIAVDSTSNAYVTGYTFSTEATFPVTVGPDLTSNGGSDAFVAKIGTDVITVSIDIRPGSDQNTVNPKSRGKIPVAILSDDTFDAMSLDTTTLTFSRTGDEDSLAFCNGSPGNVNADKLRDLLCFFNTEDTGFQAGDKEGVLKGTTLTGTPIIGTDSVRIVR